MIKCPRCEFPRPESDFHRSRTRKGGYQAICKEHANAAQLERLKLIRAQRGPRKRTRRVKIERKPSVIARIRSMSVKDRVIWAMQKGAQTREKIQEVAGIRDEDRMTDVLADLYDTNQLDRRSLRERKYRLAA